MNWKTQLCLPTFTHLFPDIFKNNIYRSIDIVNLLTVTVREVGLVGYESAMIVNDGTGPRCISQRFMGARLGLIMIRINLPTIFEAFNSFFTRTIHRLIYITNQNKQDVW